MKFIKKILVVLITSTLVFFFLNNKRAPKYSPTSNLIAYNNTAILTKSNSKAIKSTIYIAGSRGKAYNKQVATLWKNNEALALTSNNDSEALSIFVNQKDVYIAGREEKKAMLWKNSVAIELTNGSSWAEARSVYVKNSNVYVAGFQNNNATLWVNGKERLVTPKTNTTKGSIANAIFVDKDDVYVVGQEYKLDLQESKAMLWKNNTAIALPSNSNRSSATSVYVYKNDVYVVGYDGFKSILWKNNKRIELTDNNKYHSKALSIFVNDNGEYITGFNSDGGNVIATLWKNRKEFALQGSKNDSEACSVFVMNDEVYITGYYGEKGIVWKNGLVIELTGRDRITGGKSVFITR